MAGELLVVERGVGHGEKGAGEVGMSRRKFDGA